MSDTGSLPVNQATNVIPFNSSGSIAGSLLALKNARRAIADAESPEQVNKILAMATGLAAAARKATDRVVEAEAKVLKLEAERKLGQLMAAQKQAVGFNKGGGDQRSDHRDSQKPGGPPTLAEAGIDKNLADKARKAAAMSEPAFEEAKEAARDAVLTRSKPRTRKSRFDPEHCAFIYGEQIKSLAERLQEDGNVCFWHKADIPVALSNFRFWVNSRHADRASECPLSGVKQTLQIRPVMSQATYAPTA